MTPAIGVALALALIVGAVLGVMGSGGSIITVPVLVYVAGIEPRSAIPMSLAIVGVTSVLAAYLHSRMGHFHLRAAMLLGCAGMAGAYLGSAGTHLVSARTLMLSFAALLLAVGLVMLHGGGQGVRRGTCRTLRCISVGATVGVLTGFLGVGGGFLIVPALVVFAGLETKMAVGTSLAIIALNSAAGLAGQLRYAVVNWPLTITFIGLTLAGMLAGLSMSQRISEDASRKGFAVFLLIVSVAVAGTNI